MKNLSKVYKDLVPLREQKKSFKEIEKILIKKGHPGADVREIIERTSQREFLDYDKLKEEVNDSAFGTEKTINIFSMVGGFILLAISVYFFFYLYKIFNTPVETIQRSRLSEVDDSGGIFFALALFIFGFLFLSGSLSVFNSGINRIQKVKTDRERYLFLRERLR